MVDFNLVVYFTITKLRIFINSSSNFPDMISLTSNYSVLRSNVHRTMFAPQCFQMISILLDFDTKVEMVKFEKNPCLYNIIVHAF